MAGFLLCGMQISDNFFADLIDISGLGASRATDDGTSLANAGGWNQVLFSCIKRGKPFTITCLMSGNRDWANKLDDAASSITFTWPTEAGHSSGGTLAVSCGLTDVSIGGTLEGRVLMQCTVTPTGAWTYTAGTSS